jgi:NADH-quinone oxidoreductase subunit J
MDISQLVFYSFAGLAVASSVLMITRKNPVYSVMYLVLTLFSVAAIFVLLGAHFVAALQVVVYAGAILVLFLFVIMLLNLGYDFDPDIRGKFWWVIGLGLGMVLFAELFVLMRNAPEMPQSDAVARLLADQGAVGAVAEPLFENYAVAVEVTGVLLLVAMVGAVVIAKRRV